MKRIITLVLLLVFALSFGSAVAEDFSVRGGISFSSTKKEVIEFEESEGNEVVVNPTDEDYYTNNCIVCDGISFAGYDDATVVYYFDNEDKVISILYLIARTQEVQNGEEATKEIYARLNESLNSKYGDSRDKDNFIALEKGEGANAAIEWHNSLLLPVDTSNAEQRIFRIKDGYADIQIMRVYYFDAYDEIDFNKYAVAVSYTFIEESVVQSIIDSANEADAALDSDL